MDCSLPGFSVHEIFQARYWSGLSFPSPGDLPDPGIKPRSPASQADALPSEPPGKPNKQNKQNHVEFELLWGDIEEKKLKKKEKTERRKLERD